MEIGFVLLEFDPQLDNLAKDKTLRDGLSAVLQIGDTLWLANDETVSLERLSRQRNAAANEHRYSGHKQFPLKDYLRLPAPPRDDPEAIDEVDIEGLDCRNGYLWLVGSHSLKRENVDAEKHKKNSIEKNLKRLAKVTADGNRFMLARIPIVESEGTFVLQKESTQGGNKRIAAQLRGDAEGNDLTKALANDDHLKSFFAAIPGSKIVPIPGKDNGFDIEGLAVSGDRIFIGLRGPVLRGWAIILELELQTNIGDPSTLELKNIGPGDRFYRKHFLKLGGLGIRDLCVQGSDLLILSGPTMDLDGPTLIYRWPNGAQPEAESLVFRDALTKLMDVPYGSGADHAEGITLFSPDGGEPRSLLVVYDAPSKERKEGNTVKAQIFAFPPA